MPVPLRRHLLPGGHALWLFRFRGDDLPAGETRARAYQLPIVVDGVVGVTSANTAIVESAGELYTIALP